METRFGFIRDKLEIKILILFILRRLSEPVDMDTLTDLTLCDDGISFFDYADCVAELRSSGHIEETESGWVITEKGIQNGEITESSLPYSVRVRAGRNASIVSQAQQRAALITTSRELRVRGGTMVHLSMSDGMGPVFGLELLAGNDAEAHTIEKNFKKDAEGIYLHVMDLLLRETEKETEKKE